MKGCYKYQIGVRSFRIALAAFKQFYEGRKGYGIYRPSWKLKRDKWLRRHK